MCRSDDRIPKRKTHVVLRDDFDGINFYTYVENTAIHYDQEFGFDPAVVQRFNERYPEVDLRQATLTPEQSEYWYECRGYFVTLFLRELGTALHAAGKKLSIILDAEAPDYNQPWWAMPIRGNGKIRLDYETWIRDGIVDELWIQLAEVTAQRATLDKLLPMVEGTAVKLTVRAVNPFDKDWESYRQAGVSPIAVITWARNGIEAYTRAEITPDGLASEDWKIRAETLRAIAKGTVTATPDQLLPLRKDKAVLVRRACYGALAYVAAHGHPDVIPEIESGLEDSESCVRIAAALALQKASRAESATALFAAVEKHPREFQLFITAMDTLKAIGAPGYDTMRAQMDSSSPAARKLAGFGLRKLAIHKLVDAETADGICALLQRHMMAADEDILLRLHFIEQSIGMRGVISDEQRQRLLDDVTALVESEPNWEVRLKAADYCRHLSGAMAYPKRLRLKNALLALFRSYGDGSRRYDAAYGWRDVGNTLVTLGCRPAVEELMTQREDAFLAYCAYQVLYDPQGASAESRKTKGFNLLDEATAVENHRKYAPPFPGYRSW